jgi:mannose-1-phosphate guanylyltransferase/mannose-6-phosphate isomerase
MTSSNNLVHPVIMCGGSGTRLWPASRESMPKQFIQLMDEQSTFQATAQRAHRAGVFGTATVVTAADSRFIVAEQLGEAGVSADIVLEPMRRDSAAAIAAATFHVAHRDPEAIILVMPADHVIGDVDPFVEACQKAAEAARQGVIMTLGVRPTFPSPGYGYISPGSPVPGTDTFKVARFVEKPDMATAERYIADGYLWNSGYFLFRADVMVAELQRFVPEVAEAVRAAVEGAQTDLDFVRLDAEAFGRAPKISIDYAVMERTAHAGVLPVSFGWSDIGTWDALWEASPRDEAGNSIRGNAEVVATRNSLVHSDGQLTAVVGLDNVVVVSTADAVLVSSRAHSGQVKDLVAALKRNNHPEADEHLRMYRPWGWYQRIDLGMRFQVKRIMVKPGGRLSLQKHFHRAEHWVVVRGTAQVTVDDQILLRHENEAAYIPIGATHRLENPGRIPLELIEVQVGSYTGEDDIVRVEDVYGR